VKEAPALFDRSKLEWMNGTYIRQIPVDDLVDLTLPFLESLVPAKDLLPNELYKIRPMIAMTQERMKTLAEAPEAIELFFEKSINPTSEELIQKKMDAASTASALETSLNIIRDFEPFEPEPLEIRFRSLATELDVKVGALFGSIRVATTARKVAPPLFDTMVTLGKETTIERIENAITTLTSGNGNS